MNEILLHVHTREQLAAYVESPTQGLLLYGAEGAGKEHIARALMSVLLPGGAREKLDSYPYFHVIRPGKNRIITIDQIRSVHGFFRLKTTGERVWRRGLLIVDAHKMNVEAQNAFLKLLEEPPRDTLVILTANHTPQLLPTIQSRAQTITVKPPLLHDTRSYFVKKGYEAAVIDKNYLLSTGQLGLLSALLSDDSTHPLVESIQLAKEVLARPIFERLVMVDQLVKKHIDVGILMIAFEKICRAALRQASVRGNLHEVNRWRQRLAVVERTFLFLENNGQTKLLLCYVFTSV